MDDLQIRQQSHAQVTEKDPNCLAFESNRSAPVWILAFRRDLCVIDIRCLSIFLLNKVLTFEGAGFPLPGFCGLILRILTFG